MANVTSGSAVGAGYTNVFGLTNAMSTNAQVVMGGRGYLGVVINNSGSAQGNAITITDGTINAAGSVVGSTIQTITLGAAQNQVYNFPFQTGLVVQVATSGVTGIVWFTYSAHG